MSRPLRISYCGAWYHVMNRGLARHPIFFCKQHRKMFLELLCEISHLYHVEIHAYCLMNNHYHLLLRTPLANISRVMRHLDGVYTQRLNKMLNRDGPLFRGRYKAILVEADEYLLRLSRYIHLNPIKSKIAKSPEEYTWSSYKAYLSADEPSWLHTTETLSHFGEVQQRYKYKSFVEESVNDDIDNFYNENKKIPILGTETFIATVTEKHLEVRHKIEEIPEHKLLVMAKYNINQMMQKIADFYQVDELEIKHNKKNEARLVGMYLLKILGQYSFVEIASYFSNISASGVSKVYKRISQRLHQDEDFKYQLNELEGRLLLIFS